MTTPSREITPLSPFKRDGAQSRLEQHPTLSEPQIAVQNVTNHVETEEIAQNYVPANSPVLLIRQEPNPSNQSPLNNATVFLAAIRRLQEDPTLAQRLIAQNRCMRAHPGPAHSQFYAGLKREAGNTGDDEDEEETFENATKKPRTDG
jgi:hypothetical protein